MQMILNNSLKLILVAKFKPIIQFFLRNISIFKRQLRMHRSLTMMILGSRSSINKSSNMQMMALLAIIMTITTINRTSTKMQTRITTTARTPTINTTSMISNTTTTTIKIRTKINTTTTSRTTSTTPMLRSQPLPPASNTTMMVLIIKIIIRTSMATGRLEKAIKRRHLGSIKRGGSDGVDLGLFSRCF